MIRGGKIETASTANPFKNIDKILTAVPQTVSECSISVGTSSGSCLAEDEKNAVVKAHNANSIDEAKSTSGCDSERCLVENARHVIGAQADAILEYKFKAEGPTGSDLLSNVNIDTVLQQWGKKWGDFYPYNFNMLNYASYRYQGNRLINEPDTLATVHFETLYRDGYRTCACVINSDKYQGGGKHWMALFADARDPNRATIEFFNSSGRPPVPEWVNWMVKTQIGLKKVGFKNVELIKSSSVEHQASMSECGVYSLYYIWCRLNGVPVETFSECKIPDKKMFEFRQHLFADPTATENGVFDWNKFQSVVNVKWA